jgi:hypothetical protein
VRRSAAASALQDGPKFFEDVPDDVMLHSEVRERLVRLLAKRQYFALVLRHELMQGIETREDPTQPATTWRAGTANVARMGFGFLATIGPGYDRAASVTG